MPDACSLQPPVVLKYIDEPKCLSRFCRFSEEQGVTEIEISRSLAEKWIAPREGESEKSRSHRITCIRQFAIYLNNLGYDAYIVPEFPPDFISVRYTRFFHGI